MKYPALAMSNMVATSFIKQSERVVNCLGWSKRKCLWFACCSAAMRISKKGVVLEQQLEENKKLSHTSFAA